MVPYAIGGGLFQPLTLRLKLSAGGVAVIAIVHCPLCAPFVNVTVFVPAAENDFATDVPEPEAPAGVSPVVGETAHVYDDAPPPVNV